jgi:hypothetical protein
MNHHSDWKPEEGKHRTSNIKGSTLKGRSAEQRATTAATALAPGDGDAQFVDVSWIYFERGRRHFG